MGAGCGLGASRPGTWWPPANPYCVVWACGYGVQIRLSASLSQAVSKCKYSILGNVLRQKDQRPKSQLLEGTCHPRAPGRCAASLWLSQGLDLRLLLPPSPFLPLTALSPPSAVPSAPVPSPPAPDEKTQDKGDCFPWGLLTTGRTEQNRIGGRRIRSEGEREPRRGRK